MTQEEYDAINAVLVGFEDSMVPADRVIQCTREALLPLIEEPEE